MPEPLKCTHIFDDGRRCEAFARTGRTFCFSHDPQSRQEKLEAVTKGGMANGISVPEPLTTVEILSPQDVPKLLIRLIGEVRSGEVSPKVGATLGFLAGQLLKAYEVAQLANRLDAMEAALHNSPVRGVMGYGR